MMPPAPRAKLGRVPWLLSALLGCSLAYAAVMIVYMVLQPLASPSFPFRLQQPAVAVISSGYMGDSQHTALWRRSSWRRQGGEDKDEDEDELPSAAIPLLQQLEPEDCSLRDYGLLPALLDSSRLYCSGTGPDTYNLTRYTFVQVEHGDVQATAFSNLRLDLRAAVVAKPITDLKRDGGGHDPRFKSASVAADCVCEDRDERHDLGHGAPHVWRSLLANEPKSGRYDVCSNHVDWDAVKDPDREFPADVHVVLLARKDDHNPFFQISAALNAWLMMQLLGWSSNDTQLVYLDQALPTPIEELQHTVLAPKRPVVFGADLRESVVHFGSVLLAPFEATGPMMRHLDDDEPCSDSQLIVDFRRAAMEAMGVDSSRKDPDAPSCLITIISRRDYGGRKVQRVWRNEDSVVHAMRDAYRHCTIRSVDFVELTAQEQMQLAVNSDVVIGMHGAGMVNVLWTRPGTLVVEIFPKRRKRWGFRNLCRHVNCSWHSFRGGSDIPTAFGTHRDANANDKSILPSDWLRFLDPLLDTAGLANSTGRII